VGGSTVEDYLRVLRNLSLPKTYRYDEVGNPINLFLFTTIDTDTPTVLTDVAPNPPTEHYKVSDDNMTINQYRQGEIFASPAFIDPINGMDSFFHNSRIVFFYD
jgi:hypothetical protein